MPYDQDGEGGCDEALGREAVARRDALGLTVAQLAEIVGQTDEAEADGHDHAQCDPLGELAGGATEGDARESEGAEHGDAAHAGGACLDGVAGRDVLADELAGSHAAQGAESKGGEGCADGRCR